MRFSPARYKNDNMFWMSFYPIENSTVPAGSILDDFTSHTHVFNHFEIGKRPKMRKRDQFRMGSSGRFLVVRQTHQPWGGDFSSLFHTNSLRSRFDTFTKMLLWSIWGIFQNVFFLVGPPSKRRTACIRTTVFFVHFAWDNCYKVWNDLVFTVLRIQVALTVLQEGPFCGLGWKRRAPTNRPVRSRPLPDVSESFEGRVCLSCNAMNSNSCMNSSCISSEASEA